MDESVYTSAELFWYFAAAAMWLAAYAVVDYNIIRHRFVEIPFLAVCANVTWEFLYGFVVDIEMEGTLFGINIQPWMMQWLYRLGFFQDVLILAGIFLFGYKQVRTPRLQRFVVPTVLFALPAFYAAYYTFYREGFDLPLGTTSAYLDNVMMSALYIAAILPAVGIGLYSQVVGWTKGLGTAFVGVFVFLRYPENQFVQVLVVVVAILDVAYVLLLWWLKRDPNAVVHGTPAEASKGAR